MFGRQNPYQPPEASSRSRSAIRLLALKGLTEGAGWGAAIGFGRGAIQALRDATSWYFVLGGSVLAGVLIGTVVCTIGRVISGRLSGALIGFGVGLFAGLWLGQAFGGYHWTTTSTGPGTFRATGTPVGQMVGSAVGVILGAVVGASVDRVVRGGPELPLHHHNNGNSQD